MFFLLLRKLADWNFSVSMHLAADQAEGTLKIAIGSFKGVGINGQWSAKHNERRTVFRTTDSLLETQSAYGLHRDIYGLDYFTKLIQGAGHSFARGGDAPAFVVSDMMHYKIAPQFFQPLCCRYHVRTAEVIAHDFDAKITAGPDNAFDGFFVRASHHHHMRGPCFGHHLRLQVTAVHRLEIGNYGYTGKTC